MRKDDTVRWQRVWKIFFQSYTLAVFLLSQFQSVLFKKKKKKSSGIKSAFFSIPNPCGCTGLTPVSMWKEMK